MKLYRLSILFAVLSLVSPRLIGQTGPNDEKAPDHGPLNPGVVVEDIEKNSEGAKAGLKVGDILQQWSRGDVKGEIESPLGFGGVEIEQGPRGTVTLTGLRDGQAQSWKMGLAKWGLQVRPDLGEDLLTLHREARKLADGGKPVEAAQRWQEAADITANLHPGWLASWFLLQAAIALEAAQRHQEADAVYEKSIEKLPPGSLEAARSMHRLGTVVYSRGGVGYEEKAAAFYRRALEIRERLAPVSLETARSMNNLGVLAYTRADLAAAEDYYRRALAIKEKLSPGSLDVASALSNLGLVTLRRGNLDKAEDDYRRALAIEEELEPGSLHVAAVLKNLGGVAHDREDLDNAQDYLARALAIEEKLSPGSLDMAVSLTALSWVAYDRGDLDNVRAYCGRVLAIAEKTELGLRYGSNCMIRLGRIADGRGDHSKAEAYYARALAIDEKLWPGGLSLALALSEVGVAAYDRGATDKAEEYQRRALAIQEKLSPGSTDHAETLAALARIMLRKGQQDMSAQLFAQALDALESQTARLGGSEEIRSGFRARHLNTYREYVDLLFRQKQPEQAFQVVERSHARGLLETLAAAHVDIRKGADPLLLQQEHSLQESIAVKSQRRLRMLSGKHTEEQVAAADKEIADLLTRHQEVERQIRSASPVYAALTQPQPLTAEAVRQLLPDDTLLLEYSLGESRSFVFSVTANSLNSYELPPRAEIEDKTKSLYQAIGEHSRIVPSENARQRRTRLAKADAESRRAAAELSRMVLGPLAAELGQRRLLIVSDGGLQYVPFAALPVPERLSAHAAVPLIVQHEIVNLPSASVLELLRRERRGSSAMKEVAVFADPVFEQRDSRVKSKPARLASLTENGGQSGQRNQPPSLPAVQLPRALARSVVDLNPGQPGEIHLPRLAFTRDEAKAIMAAVPRGSAMEALGFDATRKLAISGELAQYRVVHFATHALVDNLHPELSGLVLSLVDQKGEPVDGFLELQDIYNMELSADLVVLSACQTALGKQINGEGMIGLTRGFMYAGAPRVVSTLWKVDDFATSRLMAHFYKAMEQDRMKPAQALRQAQLALSKEQRWSAPYYWAGFVLQGDWQ